MTTVPIFDNTGRNFSYWWKKQGSWFEQPNQRRGGFSGVLTTTDEQGDLLFIKRQDSHIFRDISHPFATPTIVREYLAYLFCQKINISTPELIYCGRQGKKATLVTKALTGFISFEEWLKKRNLENYNLQNCLRVIAKIAKTLAHFHKNRLQHNCLHPKHIFIKSSNQNGSTEIEVALLDLEKTRRRVLAKRAALHDISHLNKHTKQHLYDAEWSHFISTYEQAFGCNFLKFH